MDQLFNRYLAELPAILDNSLCIPDCTVSLCVATSIMSMEAYFCEIQSHSYVHVIYG